MKPLLATKTLPGVIYITAVVLVFFLTVPENTYAASSAVTMECKTFVGGTNRAVLDFSTLSVNMSPSVPVGTVVAEGQIPILVECALNNYSQYQDGETSEVYFKRSAIADDALGYGLTLYTGLNGHMTAEAGSEPTGIIISEWAMTSGGQVKDYQKVTLNIPYQIKRTSMSMQGSSLTGTIGTINNAFAVGSMVSGKDLPLAITNVKKFVTVKDETCSVVSDTSQSVYLSSYSISTSSGLGSGVGQTSSLTPFNIQLNCEALLSGSFDVMMQFDGNAVSGLSESGVLALNDTSTARGVGVQILNENEQSVSLATPFRVASFPLSSALITVPLFARYYQIADRITPGSANAVANYTITYQ
ncbi:type 1 fimbrial protein [Candidatus Pantoea deserta]|uniref:Type 1 fimbrial protein n=1 Tax=Candidatus Pantoea deserta TaxID=1869313 RepID=A0A3N4P997_9GAMM|nr:fimbrial protein [Pantoea deserta]RPE01261.1 type 1 fimbrial protein [Pantoea deserta]